MTEYLPRSWWANSSWSRGGAQLVSTDLHREGNVLHYPGRASAFGELSLDALRSSIRGWWNFHVNTRGWSDIGYQVAIDQLGRVVDLRGIGRVPAAHASASNPRANWHGGATLLVLGNTEEPSDAMIDAYRHFRYTVWLPRWSTATKVTGHTRVPGAQTSCPGSRVLAGIDSGTFRLPPSGDDTGDEMSWSENLSRDSSGPKITQMADRYLPDSWGRRASQLLGYAAMGSTQERIDFAAARHWGRRWAWRSWIVEENPDLEENYPDGYTMQALVQNSYGHTRKLTRWEWLRDTQGRAIWSRRFNGTGRTHGLALHETREIVGTLSSKVDALTGLVERLIERDPSNQLTLEEIEQAVETGVRTGLEDGTVSVDVSVTGPDQDDDGGEDGPPEFEATSVSREDDDTDEVESDEDDATDE